MTIPGPNPLNYQPNASSPVRRVTQSRPPTANDNKNFREGDEWLDKTVNAWYKLAGLEEGIADWILLGGSSVSLETITTPDTVVVSPVNQNINFLNGSGISITGSGDDITFAATTPPSQIQWNVITTATEPLVVDEGFIANRGAGVTFTLPASADVGEFIYVTNINAGGFTIAQNASQSIMMGNQTTTTGVGGSLASTDVGDSLLLLCYETDLSFMVLNSMGNFTVV